MAGDIDAGAMQLMRDVDASNARTQSAMAPGTYPPASRAPMPSYSASVAPPPPAAAPSSGNEDAAAALELAAARDSASAAQALGTLSTEELLREVERLRRQLGIGAAETSPHVSGGANKKATGGAGGPGRSGSPEEAPQPTALVQSTPPVGEYYDGPPVASTKTVIYPNGDKYEGECLDDFRHGRGLHQCSNGDFYDGHWREDRRWGRGKMVYSSGLAYEGEWVDDKTCGQGTCWYADGGRYDGDWKDDHRWGWGRQTWADGSSYEGVWFDDVPEGKGRWTYADGSYYEGEFGNGLRVKGKFTTRDGTLEYTGEWKDGLRHGRGTCASSGAFKYIGLWREDMQHGRGSCEYPGGASYDGDWVDGLRHGQGVMTWPNGGGLNGLTRYDGGWTQDTLGGTGRGWYEAGDVYQGAYMVGKRCGRGRCIYGNGDKYDGEWADDKRNGIGTCLYACGDRYQGAWRADRRHGYGVCIFADGTRFRGQWEDDAWVQSAADPAHSRVFGPGLARALAGEEASFGIEARDEERNARLSGGDVFVAYLDPVAAGPALAGAGGGGSMPAAPLPADSEFQPPPPSAAGRVWAHVEDNGDGSYLIRYTARVAGAYSLHVQIGAGEPVAQSPYPVRVLPASPCVAQCRVAGTGRGRAAEGAPASFYVELRDEFGNACAAAPDRDREAPALPSQLVVSLTRGGAGRDCPVAVQDKGKGRIECSYVPQQAGLYRLNVTCGGVHLDRSPYSVCVVDATGCGVALGHPAPGAAGEDDEPPEMLITAAAAAAKAAAADRVASAPPPVDLAAKWAAIAQAEFGADGSLAGWDERPAAAELTPEERHMRDHPDVPVIENLEDIYKLTRVQAIQKKAEEDAKRQRLAALKKQLEAQHGAPAAGAPRAPARATPVPGDSVTLGQAPIAGLD